jgi:hypothetical protein
MPSKKKRKPAKKKPAKKKAVVRKKTVGKKPIKKRATKKVVTKKKVIKKGEKPIGVITHYFPQVRAAVIKLKAPLIVGETIKIKGHTTDFKQTITSLQIDRVPIQSAKKGDEIGVLVDSRVRQHDAVYKA